MGLKKKNHVLGSKSLKRSPVTSVRPKQKGVDVQLYVRSGGRCAFPGCNDFLFEHHLTLTQGNFSQKAHIVAFSPGGPRANSKLSEKYINSLENLMLLCPKCHKQIDDNPLLHPVLQLRKFKALHEDRVLHVTGISANLKTTIIQLKSRVAGRTVSVPLSQIQKAVEPRYVADKKGIVIDLTTIPDTEDGFSKLACAEIRRRLALLSTPGLEPGEVQHVSVFAIAPIPLLVFLGRDLSDKVETEFFQRHRDTDDWVWKSESAPVEYALKTVRDGTDPSCVALCLSLSGVIHAATLPAAIDDRYSVYDLTLETVVPSPTFLRSRADLNNFKIAYQAALRTIGRMHAGIAELHLFPAVPAPIAVLCGRELLPKIDPKLLVYDADKAKGGFTLSIEVN